MRCIGLRRSWSCKLEREHIHALILPCAQSKIIAQHTAQEVRKFHVIERKRGRPTAILGGNVPLKQQHAALAVVDLRPEGNVGRSCYHPTPNAGCGGYDPVIQERTFDNQVWISRRLALFICNGGESAGAEQAANGSSLNVGHQRSGIFLPLSGDGEVLE